MEPEAFLFPVNVRAGFIRLTEGGLRYILKSINKDAGL